MNTHPLRRITRIVPRFAIGFAGRCFANHNIEPFARRVGRAHTPALSVFLAGGLLLTGPFAPSEVAPHRLAHHHIADGRLAAQQPPEAQPRPAPAPPAIDSLRMRLDALNREQMEEVRRVLESRQEEFDAVREQVRAALEARDGVLLGEARRAMEENRRQNAEVRRETEAALQEALRLRQQFMRDQLEGTAARVPPRNPASPLRDQRALLESLAAPPFAAGQRVVAGVELTALNPSLARYFGVDAGVLVTTVHEGSPGGRAGLMAGDVIVEVGGEPVATVPEVRQAINRLAGPRPERGQAGPAAGPAISLRVIREGTPIGLEITR